MRPAPIPPAPAEDAPRRRSFAVARERLGRFDARYSRFVGLMKLVLPLTALLLIALVVMWPQFQPDKQPMRIGYAEMETEGASAGRMSQPRFTALDDENQFYTVTAVLARQPDPKNEVVILDKPAADVALKDGSWLAVSAESGIFRQEKRTLMLEGGVSLFHDDGYEMRTKTAFIDLDKGIARGNEPVAGQGPLGLINAQGFRIDRDKETITFTGKAKMVIFSADKGRSQ
ncbi:MAG: LPS export ABC transporter periplasmic protein LptC [Alphaproteobacteria bacterium]